MASQCPAGVDCAADLGPLVPGIVSPIFVLAILAVIARLYCRRITGHDGTPSDYTVIAGLIFSAALTGLVLYSPRLGMGRHVEVVPLDQVQGLLISLYVGCVLYAVSLAVIKISILLLYRSLFPTRGMDVATKIIGLISIAWGLETALVGIFSCTPVEGFWDLALTKKRCINTTAFFTANSAVHVIIDITILALPVRKVWALKMSLNNKVVVSFMFLLGGFVCIIGIVRLFFIATLKLSDPTYNLFDTYIWSSIEVNVGVICACLPTLRPLLKKFFPKSGFATRAATAPIYMNYGRDMHRSQNQRHVDNFQRLQDCHLANMTPSVHSKTGIIITHEIEQQNMVGKLSRQATEEMWSSKHSVDDMR